MPRYRSGKALRNARHRRIRQKVVGTSQRPRLAVFRSLKHLYVQVIDDSNGTTLTSASSLDTEVRTQINSKPKTDISKMVGTITARKAAGKGVTAVVFDRGGYKYHGRIKAMADAAREGGLSF